MWTVFGTHVVQFRLLVTLGDSGMQDERKRPQHGASIFECTRDWSLNHTAQAEPLSRAKNVLSVKVFKVYFSSDLKDKSGIVMQKGEHKDFSINEMLIMI